MYIGTHACLPVVIISSIDIVRMNFGRDRILNNGQLAFIALAGVLPDFLWPHFSMHQRLNSWTHTLWFLLLLLPIVILISRRTLKNDYVKFSLIFWMAAFLHLFMDTLSGGIKFFLPFGDIIGGYYIPHPTWKIWEIVFIGSAALLLFIRYRIKQKFHIV